MSDEPIVIVGAGHAAMALCASLAEAGQGQRVILVSDEHELPYQRPPLSKAFLKNADVAAQVLRDAAWFAAAGIELILGEAALSIHREARTVSLRSGRSLAYGQLVLATGTRARRMPGWPEAANVHVLRSAQDARALRDGLAASRSVTILGGGFIGLEVAATCAALGKPVTVLEAGPRLMGRAVSEALSAHALQVHRASGVQVQLQATVGEPEFSQDRLLRLAGQSGVHDVDLLLLAIGAEPNAELAEAAGLVCDKGIVVDAHMRTSDPQILALGDCAQFPLGPARLRLESIQNAQDQARVAAANLLGGSASYQPVPWFWSEQGGMRLQMVGLLGAGPAETFRREGAQPGAFSLFHYQQGCLRCVESVNAPADYMMARKLLEAGASPLGPQVADPGQPLRALMPSA
jgi:3-phenylpropionate/trans-cinnamate dioxygenase ferredoxin reductase component